MSTKITKKDLVANYYNIMLINVYAVILAIVYGYWMYTADIKLIFCILVIIAFVLAGIVLSILSMKKFVKTKNDSIEQ